MRKYGPKPSDHPSIGEFCPICSQPFQQGDYTTLQLTRPASPEDSRKSQIGQAYTSEAIEIHWRCRQNAPPNPIPLAQAVLLFHSGGPWADEQRFLWTKLTGSSEATSKALCDLAREYL